MLLTISFTLKPKPTDSAQHPQESRCVVQYAKTTPLPEERGLWVSAGVSTPPQPPQNTDWCTHLNYWGREAKPSAAKSYFIHFWKVGG